MRSVAFLMRTMDTIAAEDFQVSVSIDEPKGMPSLQLESYYVPFRMYRG